MVADDGVPEKSMRQKEGETKSQKEERADSV